MKRRLPFSGKQVIAMAVFLGMWVAGAWFIAKARFDSQSRDVLKNVAENLRDDEDDIDYNVKWNLKYLHGIPHALAGEASIQRALTAVAAGAGASAPTVDGKRLRWENDAALKTLNQWLSRTVHGLGPDAIWVVNASGDCIAASNAGTPVSFVGTNYADRNYYRFPKEGKEGVQFAFGRVSNKAGLFFSSPVTVDNRFVGVVVAKIDMDRLSFWVRHADAFLADANGVIILAFDKSLEMKALPSAAVLVMPLGKRIEGYKRDTFPVVQMLRWDDRRFPSLIKFNNQASPSALISSSVPEDGLTIFATRPVPSIVTLDRDRRSFFILLVIAGCALALMSGSILYLFAMRMANARVTASELQYRTLFESSRDAIVTMSEPDWKFKSGNPTAIAMFGAKDEAELLTMGAWNISPEVQPDGKPSDKKALEVIGTAVREGMHYFEWTHKTLQGHGERRYRE
jgi:C4-dicarboxylate-specific signal transduction histidine kinase